MAFKALPYDSQDTAIWHSSHCHMALKSLPYGSQAIAICTQVTAIWQSSHCHMTVKPLPYGTQAIAIWHSSHCHVALKSLPYGTQATAIWQSRHCHRHVAQICHNPCWKKKRFFAMFALHIAVLASNNPTNFFTDFSAWQHIHQRIDEHESF